MPCLALILDQYLTYLCFCAGNGYELTYRGPKDESPAVIEDEVPQFSHVVILSEAKCTSWAASIAYLIFLPPRLAAFAKDITPQSLVKLLVSGTNVIFSLSQKASILTSLATEFSLVLPPPGTPLISYFPEREEASSVIPIAIQANSAIPVSTTAPVWFSGVPFALGNNPQLFSILNAPAESFAADSDSGADALVDASEKGGEGLWAGSQLSVVAGFQVAGGARAAWVGGSEIFSDAFAQKQWKGYVVLISFS